MKRAGLAAALAAAALLLGGCSAGAVSMTSGPTAATAPARAATLSPADFAAAAKRPDTVILDVRTHAEFTSGHLPGAVNLDVESPTFAESLGSLDPGSNYAVYCRSGNRSKVAMDVMQQRGFTSLFHLDGGINAWKSAGGEVVTD